MDQGDSQPCHPSGDFTPTIEDILQMMHLHLFGGSDAIRSNYEEYDDLCRLNGTRRILLCLYTERKALEKKEMDTAGLDKIKIWYVDLIYFWIEDCS